MYYRCKNLDNTCMAGRGRGRGKASLSFDVSRLGFGFGENLPKANVQPPALYPVSSMVYDSRIRVRTKIT